MELKTEIDEENNSELGIVQSDVKQNLDVNLDDKVSNNSGRKTENLEAAFKAGKREVTTGDFPEGEGGPPAGRPPLPLHRLQHCHIAPVPRTGAALPLRSPVLAKRLEEVEELDLDLDLGALEAVMTFMYRGRLSRPPQDARLRQVVEVAARLGSLGYSVPALSSWIGSRLRRPRRCWWWRRWWERRWRGC